MKTYEREIERTQAYLAWFGSPKSPACSPTKCMHEDENMSFDKVMISKKAWKIVINH